MAYGETDEFGNAVVVNPLTIHDIHATILHQLGLDHDAADVPPRRPRPALTDVHGKVVKEILE